MRIIYNSSIPPMIFGSDGVTLYPFIFIRYNENDPRTPELLEHEMVHVEQINKLGVIRFYLTYIWYSIRYGYKNNPFEVEAYERQNTSGNI